MGTGVFVFSTMPRMALQTTLFCQSLECVDFYLHTPIASCLIIPGTLHFTFTLGIMIFLSFPFDLQRHEKLRREAAHPMPLSQLTIPLLTRSTDFHFLRIKLKSLFQVLSLEENSIPAKSLKQMTE
jgi:hypothetical protein